MNKKVLVTTPIGKVEWFSLNKEDKFGAYTCNLKLEDNPETHKLISKIDSIGSGKKPYKKEADGSYTIKLKVKAKGQKRDGSIYKVNPPAIYNSLGKALEGQELVGLNVGNGSEIRAKVELSAYSVNGSTGVSCKPKSVQVVKAVEFGGSSNDLGFDALELEEIDSVEESSDDYDF